MTYTLNDEYIAIIFFCFFHLSTTTIITMITSTLFVEQNSLLCTFEPYPMLLVLHHRQLSSSRFLFWCFYMETCYQCFYMETCYRCFYNNYETAMVSGESSWLAEDDGWKPEIRRSGGPEHWGETIDKSFETRSLNCFKMRWSRFGEKTQDEPSCTNAGVWGIPFSKRGLYYFPLVFVNVKMLLMLSCKRLSQASVACRKL